MNLINLYRTVTGRFVSLAGDWLLPLGARFSFAAVLFGYYWASAMTKFSDGFFGFLTPTISAYYQILPTVTEAAGHDVSAVSWIFAPIVLLGSWAEVVLPILIVVGLFTRAAALGMIGFVIVQSLTDIYGHGVDSTAIGGWFDRISDSVILDQRLLWVLLFSILVVKGAGWLSLDRLFKIDT